MPTPPKHFKDEIQDLLDNRLDARTRAEVERHMEACTECRREFEALRWTKSFAAKQFAAKPAPSELRENILRAVEAGSGGARTITLHPSFQFRKLKPILAWAAALVALGILALILIPKHRTLPQVVARDFRSYQNQKLTLELNTPDVKKMEAFFVAHGLPFTPHVYDLSAKNYALVGGRVQYLQSRRTEWVVYRGTNNQALVCQMYVGNVSELPVGAVEREHRGRKFRMYQVSGVTMVFWQDHKVVCVLISDMPTENVVQLAFAKAPPT
ncbi:MAG: anti-sigma factor family protein [Candidatus Udaeobacter sp.]